MSSRRILRWEAIGFLVITLMGTAFHFCYEWSGGLKPLALFCAVNESVWEHAKMGFWPAVFFALIEFFAYGRYVKNFWIAKTVSFYTIPLVIIIGYYTLETLLRETHLWMHITLFIFAIFLAQLFSYRLAASTRNLDRYKRVSSLLLILILAAFALFTYFPPKIGLFLNPSSGGYGIPSK